MVGTAVVCGFGVTGIVGAMCVGCVGCAGLVDAGCGTKMQGLAGGCSVVFVASGSVSRFDTAFTQGSSCAAVDSTIAGVYLLGVLG